MADPGAAQQIVGATAGEALAWILSVGVALFGGAAGYKRWGCPPPASAPANGKLDAIPRLANSVDAFVLHMTAFTTAVSVQHASQAETMARQTALLERVSDSLTILRDRADHPWAGPVGPAGPPGPAGPAGPAGGAHHGSS